MAIEVIGSLGINPTTKTGSPEIIGLAAVHRIVLREIRQARGILGGDCRRGPQTE